MSADHRKQRPLDIDRQLTPNIGPVLVRELTTVTVDEL